MMLTDVKEMHFNGQQFYCRPVMSADTDHHNRHLVFDADRHYAKFPFNIHQILGITRHQQDSYCDVMSLSSAGHAVRNNVNPHWTPSAPAGCFNEVTCSRPQAPSSDIMRYVSLNAMQKLDSTNGSDEQNNDESGIVFSIQVYNVHDTGMCLFIKCFAFYAKL
jgi:hypothetical protein